MACVVINFFTRQCEYIIEPVQNSETVETVETPVVSETKPKRERKSRKLKNTPADLTDERREHNEQVKRQYRIT